jgi:coenzyme F420-reducing hydrogenase delta subunit
MELDKEQLIKIGDQNYKIGDLPDKMQYMIENIKEIQIQQKKAKMNIDMLAAADIKFQEDFKKMFEDWRNGSSTNEGPELIKNL